MRNRMYGGVRGRKTKVGRKLLRFPPTRLEVDTLILEVDTLFEMKTLYLQHDKNKHISVWSYLSLYIVGEA